MIGITLGFSLAFLLMAAGVAILVCAFVHLKTASWWWN